MYIICRDSNWGNPYAIYSDGYRSYYWEDSIEKAVKDFTESIRLGLMRGHLVKFASLEEALDYGDNDILWYLPLSEPFSLSAFMDQYPEHFI